MFRRAAGRSGVRVAKEIAVVHRQEASNGQVQMQVVILPIALVVLAWLGRRRLVNRLEHNLGRAEHAAEYLGVLDRYVESRGEDASAYTWLIRHSERLQSESGTHGIISRYRPPYQQVQYSNYPIFMNFPQEFRRYMTNRMSGRTARELYMVLYETLNRYLAFLETQDEKLRAKVNNPAEWVGEGASYALSAPFLLLGWIGLMSSFTIERIRQSTAVRIVSRLLVLMGVVGTAVGLVVDWQDFAAIVSGVVKGLQQP